MLRFKDRTEILYWIKEHMKTFSITQKELSKKTGIDEANLSRILKGERDCKTDTMFKILNAL